MEKIKQRNLLLEIAEQNKEIIYKDNKTLAKIGWLKTWKKNPRISEEKDRTRLKKQIEQLDVYKPLVVYLEKNNATILGGNHRYQVLKELHKKYPKKYEYLWVSVVNADSDEDKLKYALSDNDAIAKYSHEKVKELIEPFISQPDLFKQYGIELESNSTIDEFINDIAMTEQELQFKGVKKQLKEFGINDETLEVLEEMTEFNKQKEKLGDVNMQGEVLKQRMPLMFWLDDSVLYEQLQEIFDSGYANKYDTDKLLKIVEDCLGVKLPCSKNKIKELLKAVEKLNKEIAEFKEIKGDTKKQEAEKLKLKEEIKEVYGELFNEKL